MHGIYFIQDLAVILVVAGAVGWLCQRVGLSVIVGFLVAGMLVGPYTPPVSLVSDTGRIETLAQLGLVFLMFSIGMRLSVRKLRRLGFSLLIAAFGGAAIVFYLTRLLGAAMGWSSTESLFLASMLMVSSSVIISKILQETGATHDRSGQLAVGVSVLEDVVAVVMLTVLNSLVHLGGVGPVSTTIGETLGLFGAFVVLAGVGGLLLVPWLLRRLSISADEELQTLGMAALLFSLAFVAQRAGYSLALGAFLLGAIVAETPHRNQVERTFEGMRGVFSAVFFVTIGMQIDPRALLTDAGLIVGVALFTILVRPLACSLALTLIGTPLKDSLRAGVSVTPIGEFSFIIAQLGVGSLLVPEKFYPLAVGVSLLTTLVAPWLVRHSEHVADFVIARQPHWLAVWLRYYHGRIDRLKARQKRNRLWQLSRKRFIQVGVEIVLVSGVLIFSGQMLVAVEEWLGRDWLFPHGPEVLFWITLCVVLIAPLVAIWRNISALSLLYAQVATTGKKGRSAKLASIVEAAIKAVAGFSLFVWLAMLLPTDGTARWLLLASAVVALAAIILLRQRLIYWHSHLEVELQTMMNPAEERMTGTSAPWLRSHVDWNLQIMDCVLPDLADVQGRKISELDLRAKYGCSVVGIERQGFMIPIPPPDAVLYPRDRVLLMGTNEQVRAGRKFLSGVTAAVESESIFEEVQMEALVVPPWSQVAHRSLGELAPARKFGVQIAGINRHGVRILNPRADEILSGTDEVLVLGTPAQIAEFKEWILERPDEGEDADGA